MARVLLAPQVRARAGHDAVPDALPDAPRNPATHAAVHAAPRGALTVAPDAVPQQQVHVRPPRRQRTRLIGLALMLVTLLPGPVHADDLLETARRSGSFKTFTDAISTAGLTRQFKADGPYTLFIPSDSAFDKLPEGEWQALLKDRERLSKVLRYHMVAGRLRVAEVKPGPMRSHAGLPLQLKSDNGMVTVNGARVTESDMTADNGIIHAIDDVLMPPD